MSGIYIHIPFCKQACSYCDFYFVTRDRLIPEFVDALVHEITAVPAGDGSPFPGDAVRTLYLGGGTPSRLPLSQLERIFDALHRHFDLSGLTECTAEMNPEDVTAELLAGLRGLGVTRLSMGIQSFQPELLEFMHRAHSAPEAHRALESVVRAGFTSFSVDLIYGCPGQTEAQLQDDLDQLLAYDPPHLSAYSLTIEPRTRLGKQAELGRLKPADDETVVRQSRLIRDVLGANGIHQYEISNYARHGHEAEHNSAYWCHENYLGMGPAAHSFYWPAGSDRAMRWYHPSDIHIWTSSVQSEDYRIWLDTTIWGALVHRAGADIADPGKAAVSEKNPLSKMAPVRPSPSAHIAPNAFEFEQLLPATLAAERLMTGLRTRTGVDPRELSSRYGQPLSQAQQRQIEEFRNRGLMAPDNPLRLTDHGLELADAVMVRLLA